MKKIIIKVFTCLFLTKIAYSMSVDSNYYTDFSIKNNIRLVLNHDELAQKCINIQYKLGINYLNGIGLSKDEKEAAKWFQLSADRGHTEAQYNLAICHLNGIGLSKDEKEAAKWFQLSADRGHTEAQYNLALCYDLGIGVNENKEYALFYYFLAEKKGNENAKYNLNILIEELNCLWGPIEHKNRH